MRDFTYQRGADPPTLKFIDDAESHLCRARLNEDIAPCAHDRLIAILVSHHNQGDMVDEVDVEKMLNLLFREVALGCEETTIKGFAALFDKGRLEILTILRALRADILPTLLQFRRVSITEKLAWSSMGNLVIVRPDVRRQRRQP